LITVYTVYTVKQLSDLAGISVRTLHHYDAIGLLVPARIGKNGYRYYDEASLLRLQQILFYREIGLALAQIKEVLDSPDFDLMNALRSHRAALQERISRLRKLVRTVDSTMQHLMGKEVMSKKQLFTAFSNKKQKHYERLARLEYGPELVDESIRRWNSYSKAKRGEILAEGGAIYADMVKAIEAGRAPESAEMQAILTRWHDHIRYFYEPTLEILRGLGQHYNAYPEFNANFTKLHPELPEYLETAITRYVDELETAEIKRLLEKDERRADHGAGR
jgi:DNA-binding transcriptional MerR regulator